MWGRRMHTMAAAALYMPPTPIDFDFRGSEYWLNGTRYTTLTDVPGVAYTGGAGGGVRCAEDAFGKLIPFADNVPRRTSRGIALFESVTNKCTMEGANPVDTTGATGATANVTVVDDTAALQASGLDLVCTSGRAYMCVNNTAGALFLNIAPASANTNTATISAYMRSIFGPTTVNMSAGFGASAPATPTLVTDLYQRVSVTQTQAIGSLAFIRIGPGQAFMFVLPQWEEEPAMTPVIPSRASVTTTATADVLTLTGVGALLGAPDTLFAYGDMYASNATVQELFTISDGTVNNLAALRRDATGQAAFGITAAGVAQPTLTVAAKGGLRIMRAAGRVRAATEGFSVDNAVPLTGAITAPTGMNQLTFGVAVGGASSWLNGYLQMAGVTGDTTDAQMQNLTL